MTPRPPRAFLDSAVFIYAVGADHQYRAPCRHLLEAVGEGRFTAEVSVLAIEEVLHQRTRRTGDRESARRIAGNIAGSCVVRELRRSDVELGLRLFVEVPALDARDSFHAATALRNGLEIIVSPDRAFDGVTGLRRVDPGDTSDW